VVKVHVRVGEVSVTVEGLDYTRRQVRALLGSVYATACLMTPEPEERPTVSLGFVTEILPDVMADEPGYEDED
jgi:hypothetical protein